MKTNSHQRLRLAPIMSWLVLGASGLVLLIFVIQAGQFTAIQPDEPEPATPLASQQSVFVGQSAISGFDQEGQPFSIDSSQAVQDIDTPNIVHLTSVSGQLRRKSGALMRVGAEQGAYDSKTKMLELKGQVRIVDQDRFAAEMPSARVALDKKALFTETPVVVTFEGGQIMSNGLKISNNAREILFFNRVRARYIGGAETKKDKRE